MLRFVDVLKVMCVRAADHITFLKIRMFPADLVKMAEIVEFRAGKCASGRNKSEIGEQACRSLIYMRRVSGAA